MHFVLRAAEDSGLTLFQVDKVLSCILVPTLPLITKGRGVLWTVHISRHYEGCTCTHGPFFPFKAMPSGHDVYDMRTPEETEAPLKDPNSEVYKAGLRLVNSFTRVTPCPYRASWIANPQQDAITYARDYVLTTRTWSNATYLGGLSDSRSPEEKSALVDELFERYAQDVAKSPADHGMDYCHCILTVEKV